ncbi:MAG: tRNA (adenosine(37)-N6)-threonylcarbamoyltransferase complex dimerization subunit type 1 TsaB [Planctomycetota bacterium]
MLLAVETSSSIGSIALMSNGVMVAERQLGTSGPRHAQTLVPELDRLLRELGSTAESIEAIAISIGPGSFTGLRVGLTFAKTLAWLNQAPLLAIDTLQAIAQQAASAEPIVTAVCDAQRGELFAASYELDSLSGLRHRLGDIRVHQITDLIPEHTVIGPLPAGLRERVAASRVMASESVCMPRASTVARLGDEMLKNSRFSSPETLEPVYIRVSYAEEKRPASPQSP